MLDESTHEPAPPFGARRLIDREEDFSQVVSVLAQAPVLGIDVEAGIPPRERQSKFALLQIAIPGQTFAIDPLRLRDLSALAPVMVSETILKVFHGIALDRDMLEGAGLNLRFVADLSEVARSAFGKGEASLAAFARRAFGVGIDKSLQRSAWLHRPLDLPSLAYAWRDAELTLGLYNWSSRHLPDLLSLHTSLSARAEIPESLAPWVQAVLNGSRQPAFDLLALHGLDIDLNAEQIVGDCMEALAVVRLPYLRGRLLRVIGELELFELVAIVRELLRARSALERASAARALATMGEASAEADIRALLDDPTEEVRQAAEQALLILPQRIPATNGAGASDATASISA
jgi:hypothetical protein